MQDERTTECTYAATTVGNNLLYDVSIALLCQYDVRQKGRKRCAYSSGSSSPSEPSSSTSSTSSFPVIGRISSSPEDAPSSLRAAAHASVCAQWYKSRHRRHTHAACLGDVAQDCAMRCWGRNSFEELKKDRRNAIDVRREGGGIGRAVVSEATATATATATAM